MVSAVKACRCTRARSRSGLAERSRSSVTLTRVVGRNICGGVSIMPRASSAVSTPARFSAVRCPAMACSAAAPCTCTPRTRTRLPAGWTCSSCSLWTVPEISVPVTTVPKPFMVKTRSMGRRKAAAESFAGISAARRASSVFRRSRPSPVLELTATMGEFA